MQIKKHFLLIIFFTILIISVSGCTNNNYNTLEIINDSNKAEVVVSPKKEIYKKNEKVNIKVIPKDGYKFTHWSGDINSSSNEVTIVMDDDKKIVTNFMNNGSINIIKKGPGNIKQSEENNKIILEAIPAKGFVFDEWLDVNNNVISKNPKFEFEDSNYNKITAKFILKNEIKINGPGKISYKEYGNGYFEIGLKPLNQGVLDKWYGIEVENIVYSSNYKEPLKSKVIKIKSLSSDFLSADFKTIKGAFKLINSWGKDWGFYNDGSIMMSYAAAINADIYCHFFIPRVNYDPNLVAEFEIDGIRDGVDISFIKNNSKKEFYPETEMKGGNKDFPDNKIVLDITELLPFENEELLIKINNYNFSEIVLNSLNLRHFNDYSIDDLSNSKLYSSNTNFPLTINSGKIKYISIENLSINVNSSLFSLDNNINFVDAISRNPTKKEINHLSLDKNNYNSNNKFGTGLKIMTENEMKKAVSDNLIKYIDSTKIYNKLASNEFPTKVDHSKSQYFPPVANQFNKNSCLSWSMSYYTQTFYEAREHNWNLDDYYFNESNKLIGDQSKIMSPDFTYHLINDGKDNGSYATDVLRVIKHLGNSSWENMSYNLESHKNWPNELAWREAPIYRSSNYKNENGVLYYLEINSIEDINIVKKLLNEGYLLTIAVDSSKYYNENEKVRSTLKVENYGDINIWNLDHANTLVGYDDE